MEQTMMIDYRDNNGKMYRKAIQNCEFCVRDGLVYFMSGHKQMCVNLNNIIQVYMD